MYITEVLTKTTPGKIAHRCILLRESYREHGKVKTRTLANLTHCPPQDRVALRWALQPKQALFSPAVSPGLLERLARDALSAEDRDLLGQWLQVMLAAPPPLDHRGQPTPPAALRKATRTRPLGKTARRRQRRSAGEGQRGQGNGEALEPRGCPASRRSAGVGERGVAALHQVQDVQQCLDEVKSLRERLGTGQWQEADWGTRERVLGSYERLLSTLCEAQITRKRLQTLLLGTRRRRRPSVASGRAAAGDGQAGSGGEAGGRAQASGAEAPPGTGVGTVDETEQPARAGGHRPGYGRVGTAAYEGAERVECHHETLAVGPRCPVCGQGRLSGVPPGVESRLDGNAFLAAIRSEVEKLRCSACGQVCPAPLPTEAGAEKDSPRARAGLAVGRSYVGLPLYRMEASQAMVGVPVPDATQWEQIERVADWGYGVFAPLERWAAPGELIHQDDTTVRMLALMEENHQRRAAAAAMGDARPTERTGMCTTALVVQVGERTSCLYDSGRAHAGENLKALLAQRQAGLEQPLVLSDALSRHTAAADGLMRCHCLAHGRRQCSEREDVLPDECTVVITARKEVFDHDAQARAQQRSAEERWAYHQAASRPIMEALTRWLDTQCEERNVEPNRSLGKAMASLGDHWGTLTRCLSVAGAPLDNHLVERAFKLFIRQRKNSRFSKTESSADMASVLTSLMATCLHAGVNALESLGAVQEHRAAVCANPAAWLPWNSHTHGLPP